MYISTAIGRIVRDPELRYTQKGTAVASFSIACKRSGSKDKTDFADVKAFGQSADFIYKYGHKGDFVTVTGNQCVDSFVGRDGTNKKMHFIEATSVELTSSKPKESDTMVKNKTYVEEMTKTAQMADEILQNSDTDNIEFVQDDLPF